MAMPDKVPAGVAEKATTTKARYRHPDLPNPVDLAMDQFGVNQVGGHNALLIGHAGADFGAPVLFGDLGRVGRSSTASYTTASAIPRT